MYIPVASPLVLPVFMCMFGCFGCVREESPGCAIIMQSIAIGVMPVIGKEHMEIKVS